VDNVLSEIKTAVISGDLNAIVALTERALDEGLEAGEILSSGLMPGMQHVGEEFKVGRVFVPEVLLSARTMKMSMSSLQPYLGSGAAPEMGEVVIGTVKGDLHDIGKNLVRMMMEGAGFRVHDLGIDVSPQAFVGALKDRQPGIVAMSALLTTTMVFMEDVINAINEAGMRDRVRIMVGGAPVTADFAARIGADGYAPNAAEAADLARELIGGDATTARREVRTSESQ